MRVSVRVHPGSRHPAVGGRQGDALVVRVRERAVDGRATDAVLAALADALDLPRAAVVLVHGARSRSKLVEIPDAAAGQVEALRGGEYGDR